MIHRTNEPLGFTYVVLFCILFSELGVTEWRLRPHPRPNGARKDFAAQLDRQDVGLLITDNQTFERSLIC